MNSKNSRTVLVFRPTEIQMSELKMGDVFRFTPLVEGEDHHICKDMLLIARSDGQRDKEVSEDLDGDSSVEVLHLIPKTINEDNDVEFYKYDWSK